MATAPDDRPADGGAKRTRCPYCVREIPAQCMFCPHCDLPIRNTRAQPKETERPDREPPRWAPSRKLAALGVVSLLSPVAIAALSGEFGLLLGAMTIVGVLAPFLVLLVYLERDRRPVGYGPEWFALAPLEIVGAFALAMLVAGLFFLCVGFLFFTVCTIARC